MSTCVCQKNWHISHVKGNVPVFFFGSIDRWQSAFWTWNLSRYLECFYTVLDFRVIVHARKMTKIREAAILDSWLGFWGRNWNRVSLVLCRPQPLSPRVIFTLPSFFFSSGSGLLNLDMELEISRQGRHKRTLVGQLQDHLTPSR